MFNPLLERQLRKYLGADPSTLENLRPLLAAISTSYDHFEHDRRLIERSMDISSEELMETNGRLRHETDRQRMVMTELVEALAALAPESGIEQLQAQLNNDVVAVAQLLREQIDRRRDAELALSQSEERFRLLAETASDLIIRHDLRGVPSYVSPSSRTIVGFEPEEMLGRSLLEYVHPEDLPIAAPVMKAVSTEGTPATVTVRVARKDGTYCWLETSVRAIRDPDTGEIIEISAASRDITQRIQAEEVVKTLNTELRTANELLRIERDREKEHVRALEKLNAMKSEFVSSVSHELRTPLAAIIGFIKTMRLDPDLSDETREEFMGIIESEGARLANLIEDVLDVSRLEAGSMQISPVETNLIPVIKHVSATLAPKAEAKRITLQLDLPEGRLPALVDPEKMPQIIYNLVENAIKFTPSAGHVRVHAWDSGTDIRITVTDSGIGIAAEDQASIFEKFHRVSNQGLVVPGTGLGLAITRQLAELHGGTVTVESTPGVGSTFTVTLPLAE